MHFYTKMNTFSSIIDRIELAAPTNVVVQFTSQTAGLNLQILKNAQGRLLKHTLTFEISPISRQNDMLVDRICKSSSFIVTDIHGYVTFIGSSMLPPSISVDKQTSGTAGGVRAYRVAIEWSTI